MGSTDGRQSRQGRHLFAKQRAFARACDSISLSSAIFGDAHVARLPALKAASGPKGRGRSTRHVSAKLGWRRCVGRQRASKTRGAPHGAMVRLHRQPPIWTINQSGCWGQLEAGACPHGHLHRAQCRPPVTGPSPERGSRLQTCEVGCNSLRACQIIQVWVAGIPAAL